MYLLTIDDKEGRSAKQDNSDTDRGDVHSDSLRGGHHGPDLIERKVLDTHQSFQTLGAHAQKERSDHRYRDMHRIADIGAFTEYLL
jgi:hypothetical protein